MTRDVHIPTLRGGRDHTAFPLRPSSPRRCLLRSWSPASIRV